MLLQRLAFIIVLILTFTIKAQDVVSMFYDDNTYPDPVFTLDEENNSDEFYWTNGNEDLDRQAQGFYEFEEQTNENFNELTSQEHKANKTSHERSNEEDSNQTSDENSHENCKSSENNDDSCEDNSYENTEKCGDFEEWSKCANPRCRPTCQFPEKFYCDNCIPGCVCIPDYLWDQTLKKCIPSALCPQECGQHAHWSNCTRACQHTCLGRLESKYSTACLPGCQCDNGFVLDTIKRKCVTSDNCTKHCNLPTVWCQYLEPHQVTCQNMLYPRCHWNKFFHETLYPGCMCPFGTVVNQRSGNCISLKDCYLMHKRTGYK